jgi:hypothetical protein
MCFNASPFYRKMENKGQYSGVKAVILANAKVMVYTGCLLLRLQKKKCNS